ATVPRLGGLHRAAARRTKAIGGDLSADRAVADFTAYSRLPARSLGALEWAPFRKWGAFRSIPTIGRACRGAVVGEVAVRTVPGYLRACWRRCRRPRSAQDGYGLNRSAGCASGRVVGERWARRQQNDHRRSGQRKLPQYRVSRINGADNLFRFRGKRY